MPIHKHHSASFNFDEYYKRYFPILFRFALKNCGKEALSKDLAQNTLIKFWKHWNRESQEKKAIEAFLFKTLKNEIIDCYRKQKVVNSYALKMHPKSTFEDTHTLFDIEDRIKKVYTKLPEKTRRIFQLSREKGVRNKDIAAQLTISEKTVEYHISNALKMFRNEFYNTP